MIKVSLIAKTNEVPTNLISHAARTCYTSTVPEMGTTMDVKSNLFNTGHHTTLQHSYFTFNIDGLSVSSTIFGLHLCHSFYNSDQRSGRFSKMYKNPDFEEIESYISKYWGEEAIKNNSKNSGKVEPVSSLSKYSNNNDIQRAMDFIRKGREIYKENIKSATEIAAKFIKEERPFATDEYIETNAPKIAQEQMRMFISTISPTALDHTINLSAITALYRSAWSPELREITSQMKDLILQEYPDLDYMFDESLVRETNWVPELKSDKAKVYKTPYLDKMAVFLVPSDELDLSSNKKDSVDLGYFTPEKMNNSISMIRCRIEVSLATMGQDQRHRTIKRGTPALTGAFYLPPILDELKLKETALSFMEEYIKLYKEIDPSLALAIAPYGAVASYGKYGDLNAMIHEQEKRLCWSAQEEIYNLSKQFHDTLINNFGDGDVGSDCKKIADLMLPSCYHGKCIEGRRYCGRDVSKVKTDRKVPYRNI